MDWFDLIFKLGVAIYMIGDCLSDRLTHKRLKELEDERAERPQRSDDRRDRLDRVVSS